MFLIKLGWWVLLNERDWLILKVLYEKKNITKAAQSLYISQPSLTKKIKQIEQEFNITMVQRGTKGIQFTTQGEYLAQCADEMLARLSRIKEVVLNMEEEVSGTLRIGVTTYMTKHKLPKWLKLFKERYPKVDFKVTTALSREIFQRIYNSELHIGILHGNYDWSGPKSLLLEENICVASKEKIALEELPTKPMIHYGADNLLKHMIDNWWSSQFTTSPFIGMEVDKIDTCKEMVLNGLGYGILPRDFLEEHDELYLLNLLNEMGEPLVRKTWMCYHDEALEMKLVKEFVTFIEETL